MPLIIKRQCLQIVIMDKLFNKSVKGSSHYSSGKPCQDYSLTECTDNYSIAIVSDGHGSDTYVRSQIGSEIAAKVAKKHIIDFLPRFYGDPIFKDILIKVGPKPSTDRAKKLVRVNTGNIPDELAQEIKYFEAIENNEEIDNSIRSFFELIYREWIKEINEHAIDNPLTNEEQNKLGRENITKAYGCTLICALTTNDFCFAFQIGDGRCYFSDSKNEWTQPIPWDCKCFLNITTSLCLDNNPVNEFRYYFNSKGQNPQVICIGSDGIDGSYDVEKEIELDYYAIIDEYIKSINDQNIDFNKDLEDFLTQKSLTFSHDDMSVSCIVKEEGIATWLKLNKIKKDVYIEELEDKKRKKEISRKETILENLSKRQASLKSSISTNKKVIEDGLRFIAEWGKKISNLTESIRKQKETNAEKNKENTTLHKDLTDVNQRISVLTQQLEDAKRDYQTWLNDTKSKVSSLKDARTQIIESLSSESSRDGSSPIKENWDSCIREADLIILGRIGDPSECYSFHAESTGLSIDEGNGWKQRGSNPKLFQALKDQLFDEISKGDYFDKKTENCYIYVSFLKDDHETYALYIPIEFEPIFNKIFMDSWQNGN